MFYTFQESFIWDGASDERPDPSAKKVRIKAKTEDRARKLLPKNSGLGRHWLLVLTEERQQNN